MQHKVLFLTLRVFSATGGIEKVCRIAGKALYELGLQFSVQVKIFSMYGKPDDADAKTQLKWLEKDAAKKKSPTAQPGN